MAPITLFHNPACGTSRNVLALIRDSGVEPRVVEYLKTPTTGPTSNCWTSFVQHPLLMNRPIVQTPLATRLCRPSETAPDLLPDPQSGAFIKEDGEPVIDAERRLVVR